MTKAKIYETESSQINQMLIELDGSTEYNAIILAINNPEELKQMDMRALLSESMQNNRPIAGITTFQYNLFSFIDRSKDIYQDALDFFREILEICSENKPVYYHQDNFNKPPITASMPLIIIQANCNEIIDDYETAYNNILLAMEKLSQLADNSGIFLAFENPANGVLLSPLEIRQLIDSCNSPFFGLCFNPGNADCLGESLDWFRIIDRRILALHIQKNFEKIQNDFENWPNSGPIIINMP